MISLEQKQIVLSHMGISSTIRGERLFVEDKEPTEEEYRAKWLEIQNTPTEPSEIEKFRIEQAKANAEMIELMISMLGGGF